jgi:hypothetical protein
LITASSAAGAVRYAEVGGSGDPTMCLQADPCSLEDAVEHASVDEGDEIVVMPGTYDLGSGNLFIPDDPLSLHGAAGGPRPVVTTSGAVPTLSVFLLSSVAVTDIEFVSTGPAPAISSSGASPGGLGVTFERVLAQASNSGVFACQLRNSLIRDSVCHNTGGGPAAGFAAGGLTSGNAVVLRNVTAYAPADLAIEVSASQDANVVWNGKNVIARGGAFDVSASQNPVEGSVAITLENSNFDAELESGGATVTSPSNQTAAPLLVDPNDGDYGQAPGSPTIDAGALGDLGTMDLDGDQRTIDGDCDGAAVPDIGADEFTTSCPEPQPPAGDTEPPDTTITSGPKDKTKKKQATFEFTSNEPGSTFQCAVDGQSLNVPCTSPFTVKVKKGQHTFQVRATDQAGNADGSPATDGWKVKKKKK